MGITTENIARRLLTISQFATEHTAFTESALRHLIFNASRNGFDRVVRRIGRRKVLIDEAEFFAWVDAQQVGGR